jgi:hypothetical protein
MSLSVHGQTSLILGLNVVNYLFLIRLFNSSLALTHHVPSLSFVHLIMLLNIFLSVISDLCFIDSFYTHVLLAHVITGLIIVQYNCNLAFFYNNLLSNVFLIGIISFTTHSNSFFNLFCNRITSIYNSAKIFI